MKHLKKLVLENKEYTELENIVISFAKKLKECGGDDKLILNSGLLTVAKSIEDLKPQYDYTKIMFYKSGTVTAFNDLVSNLFCEIVANNDLKIKD